MKKSLVTLTTVAIVGISSVFISNTVQAETITNLKDKQSEVNSERSSIKVNLSEAENKIVDIMIDLKKRNKKIAQVDKALNANKNKMAETKGKITETKGEVEDLEDEITTLENEIEKRYEILKERIVSYQESGGNIGYMDVIFGSKSFGEFISRISAVNKITQSDKDLMKAQEKAKRDVEAKQDKVKNKLEDLKGMKDDLEGMKETILVQKAQNEKAKEALENKKQDLEGMKEDLQLKDSSLAAIEAEVGRTIAQKNVEREREIAAAQAAVVAAAREEQEASSNDSDSREIVSLSSVSSNDLNGSSDSSSSNSSSNSDSSNDTNDSNSSSNSDSSNDTNDSNSTSNQISSNNTNNSSNASDNADHSSDDRNQDAAPTNEPKQKTVADSEPKQIAPSVSGGGMSTVISAGMPYLGTPYVWSGESPSGFDCSGFISWAYAQAGISIPRSTSQLINYGKKVSYSNIQPGDIVFFFNGDSHAGIYIGGGKFIGSQSSTGLAIEYVKSGYWGTVFKGHVRRVR